MVFDYKAALSQIPHQPGVYQYWDESDTLLYIGKAKDLRNRVASYFVKDKNAHNRKTQVLVSKIRKITFTIVDTEVDAALLENNLIKKFQPRYNILLKDDKTYPWIVMKKEPFPRIFWTRKVIKDGSKYYGPYASLNMMHTVLDFIKETYPLRTCNLSLTDTNIKAGKFKICLEYQIGNCKGPCQALQTATEYDEWMQQIHQILNGKIASVVQMIQSEMQDAAKNLNFEKAHELRLKLDTLEKYQSRSTVVSPIIRNVDVYSIASDEKFAFINFLRVIDGNIIQTKTIEIKKRLDETEEELLQMAIVNFRTEFDSNSGEILVPFALDSWSEGLQVTVPKSGDKLKLLELSQKNVLYFRKEKLNQYDKLNPEFRTERILAQMQKDLRLKHPPAHIECFDNSNFQGKYPVSAMVVFKNAKPSKKDYRHYNVKTVEGPNDFATMEEVVYRRYKRVLEEQLPLPQLIIIDGGKGQLSSAIKSLKALGVYEKVAVLGIAKRLEELFYPNDPIPLYLDKKSETLKIIQQLRDEAHRFGITFHRAKRDKGTLKTELQEIEGIGVATAQKLLQHFKSVKNIQSATENELLAVVNLKQAKAIGNYFDAQKKS